MTTVTSPQRVLVLEDMPSDAELAVQTLRRAGMTFDWQRVDTEADFKRALVAFQPTIVLTDFNLPTYTGGHAVRFLREQYPEIPVIVVTGALGDNKVVELLRDGAVDYILKDRLGRLPYAVKRALKNAELAAGQNRAIAQLRENETFLAQAQAVAQLGSWRWEYSDNKLYFSKEAYRLFGLPHSEMGQEPQEFFRLVTHPLDYDALWENLLLARETQSNFAREIRILQPTGHLHWLHSTAQPVFDDAGVAIKMIGAALDVTERKTLEIELANNLNLLKLAMDSAGESVWKLKFSTGRMTFSKQFYTLLGFDSIDVIQRKDQWLSLVHPDDRERVIGRLNRAQDRSELTYIDEYRIQAQNGSYRWLQSRGAQSSCGSDDDADLVGITLDIDDSKRMELEFQHLAYHDRLTGLPNRMLFFDRLGQTISLAKRSQSMVAVIFADLDGFKQVNDEFGHAAGDQILRIAAVRLLESVRGADTVARFGGDEFAVILGNLSNMGQAAQVAERLIAAFATKISLSEKLTCRIGVSLGISFFPQSDTTLDGLVSAADAAMYQSKQSGRNSYTLYKAGDSGNSGDEKLVEQTPLLGIQLLDEQHHHLAALINQLHRAWQEDLPMDQILAQFDTLGSETRAHFAFEEAMMTQYQYPMLTQHRKEHVALIDKLKQFRAQLQHGGVPLVLKTLNDWLLIHISYADQQMADHLKRVGHNSL